MGTSSFLLISLRRVAEESQRPRRWKQWLHTARDMRDSETPVQPKRAKTNATMSLGDRGGSVPAEVKKDDGMRSRMWCMDGSGYVMCSRRGRSADMALRKRYRSSNSAELFVRDAIGI